MQCSLSDDDGIGADLIPGRGSAIVRTMPESRDPAQPPRVVELFAGVGGFRLGLEPSGFETVWANQWEPSTRTQHAYDCYIRHFGDKPGHVCEDIERALDEVEAGRAELPTTSCWWADSPARITRWPGA